MEVEHGSHQDLSVREQIAKELGRWHLALLPCLTEWLIARLQGLAILWT